MARAGTRGTTSRARTAGTTSVDTSKIATSPVPGVGDTAGLTEQQLTGASEMAASGALIEPEIATGIDFNHPAVDSNPRAGQPAASNRTDFNDPAKSDADAVADNLKAQA